MALRKKPIEMLAANERQIEKIIEKGGTVGSEQKGKRRKQSNFPLRFMQDDMAGRIEAAMSRRPLKPSMNAWINEAILDKLKSDG
jgi:hypothetical protein